MATVTTDANGILLQSDFLFAKIVSDGTTCMLVHSTWRPGFQTPISRNINAFSSREGYIICKYGHIFVLLMTAVCISGRWCVCHYQIYFNYAVNSVSGFLYKLVWLSGRFSTTLISYEHLRLVRSRYLILSTNKAVLHRYKMRVFMHLVYVMSKRRFWLMGSKSAFIIASHMTLLS
jgi:hypothetical protein